AGPFLSARLPAGQLMDPVRPRHSGNFGSVVRDGAVAPGPGEWRHDLPQTQEDDMGEGPVNGTGIGRLWHRWHRWRRPYTAVLSAGVLAAGGAVGTTVGSVGRAIVNTHG